MTPKLDAYRSKRTAGRTPEPVPSDEPEGGRPPGRTAARSARRPGSGRFVIQEHHARALHWDFRLERDGVLVSWALPKGLPPDPGRNHLAVPTEDHPLEYAEFEGDIPAGEYGGGRVSLWDRGTYTCEKWSEREVMVVLDGARARGRYVLFRTGDRRSSSRENWMIHRMDPAPAGWAPPPPDLRPMLARPGSLPADDAGWAYELKWDGVRAVVHVDGGRVRVVSRNDRDVTAAYPELRALGEEMGSRQAVLDGEIVALDEAGRPRFSLLQQRMHVADDRSARRLADLVPATYLVFDLLYLNGDLLVDRTYDERRAALESLGLGGPNWAVPPAFTDLPGTEVAEIAAQRALEGVVAKRRESRYEAGRRSGAWVKVKRFATQEVVVGGWTPGKGRRGGQLGALLLGVPRPGGLAYVGKVGTGFTDDMLEDLGRRLRRLDRATSPFVGALPRAQVAGASWVRPTLVGEVQFSEWTADGRLRHPSWRGLRPDKAPAEVVRES